jgi:2-polyprenyl-6-hydroxyphenyl methylase/3-demethylubiquinone-9 3-methyltransferase
MSTETETTIAKLHESEVLAGERFEFGNNWASFLKLLDDERIEQAESSLCEMLEVDGLERRTFLDIGSGSGLFSLAARRLGASVFSFDFDSNSVACTRELKRRYFPSDGNWTIEQASVLDENYVRSIGKFDVVYSWGVLHHTGEMWKALEIAGEAVADGGLLFVAIYNDTGSQARRWKWIKRTYCKLPSFLKLPFAIVTAAPGEAKRLISNTVEGRPLEYIRDWRRCRNGRGMDHWSDIIDWVGGYPYEVATADEIFDFYKKMNFRLNRIKTGGVGLGCNEFVFEKIAIELETEST